MWKWSRRAAAEWPATSVFAPEHYDVSVKMAELALLPAVRAAAADTLIVADGTSCRHQIADLTRGAAPRSATPRGQGTRARYCAKGRIGDERF
jgi:hypothetical protein